MTYAAHEDSLEIGTPVELYEFIQGLQRWNYASGSNEVIYLGQTFVPSPVQRDGVKQTTDTFKSPIKLVFPRGDSFASQYLSFAPEEVTTVTIYRGHYGDPDAQFIFYWKGRVVGVQANLNQIEVQCESVFTSIRRPGLRARFEYNCRRTLYAKGCDVNRELHKVQGAIMSITSGLKVDVAEAAIKPDGYYTGGIFLAPGGASRMIVAHTGAQVTLVRPIPGLAAGTTAAIYPGCDHLRETCKNKFGNLDRFGGFPFIPGRNPFDGSSIV